MKHALKMAIVKTLSVSYWLTKFPSDLIRATYTPAHTFGREYAFFVVPKANISITHMRRPVCSFIVVR